MSDSAWRFVKFGLIVTGDTEAQHLPMLFRSLTKLGTCYFEVIRQIGQRSPITSDKKKLKMVGSGQTIPNRDEEEIGLEARRRLNENIDYVLLIDDLEQDRRDQATEVFNRYRLALDTMLSQEKHRASVHFLVNMLEAYYFADASAVNSVLGTSLEDCDYDVEEIPHPKNKLKAIYQGFEELEHGGQILACLDTEKVLSNPDTCASLRTLFAWCWQCLHQPRTDQYQLLNGKLSSITQIQLSQDSWRGT
ncbi:DUF4276 family protein [Pseudanabaena sp. PCC 6802]|uniref:DUF4276 family protein n=1 Tax=Pseudanabaena sp. PCC 6802 TaxID=118173 RepID=UPI00034C6D1A|nr:DUF4276 family protein [Pseudanabaena sp. PCC 6802]